MPPSLRLLLASLLLCAHSNAAENSRPHIILIMGDDHGWEEWLFYCGDNGTSGVAALGFAHRGKKRQV